MVYQAALHVVPFLPLAFTFAVLSPFNVLFKESAWPFPSPPSGLCSNTI